MIDLRNKSLPNAIAVDGRDFLIKTDFREWLKFSELGKEQRPLSDYYYLFVDEIPYCDFFHYLVDFYINENVTPNYSESSNEEIFDYILDGEYIVASFWKEYQIDLTSIDYLHWHVFKSLFIGLSDDSKIKQIMSMRAYKKSNKKYEEMCLENKRAWELPKKQNDELIKEINELFYGAK